MRCRYRRHLHGVLFARSASTISAHPTAQADPRFRPTSRGPRFDRIPRERATSPTSRFLPGRGLVPHLLPLVRRSPGFYHAPAWDKHCSPNAATDCLSAVFFELSKLLSRGQEARLVMAAEYRDIFGAGNYWIGAPNPCLTERGGMRGVTAGCLAR